MSPATFPESTPDSSSSPSAQDTVEDLSGAVVIAALTTPNSGPASAAVRAGQECGVNLIDVTGQQQYIIGHERRERVSERSREHDDPFGPFESVPLDTGAEQRKLEEAGWERVHRQDKLLWRPPEGGHLYPQGAAVQRLLRDSGIEPRQPPYEKRGGA